MGIFKDSGIYKTGLDVRDISKLLTDWEDITNEFTINDPNLELNYGKILKNETFKQIKISIRLDLKSSLSLNQYEWVEKRNILLSNYSYEDGISSLNAAYIDNRNEYIPRGTCMMWNDEHTINVQLFNPSNHTLLNGFIIESTLIYK